MLLGADNLSFEAFPPERTDNWVPVHTYLLAEKGVMFIEQMNLEELAKDTFDHSGWMKSIYANQELSVTK